MRYYDYLWINKKSSVFGIGAIYTDTDLSTLLKKDVIDELLNTTFPLRKVGADRAASTHAQIPPRELTALYPQQSFPSKQLTLHKYK
jgi:hypothetical protein